MSKKVVGILIIGGILIGGYWLYHDKNRVARPIENKVNEPSPKDTIISSFLEKYSAINTTIDGNTNYTFQLEDQLIKQGKPVVLTGQIDDIFRKGDKFYLRISPSWFDFGSPQKYYTLGGCEDKIDEIASRKTDASFDEDEYAIVAKIDSVKKPILKIDGSITEENDVELEYASSDIFLITGECIDLALIKDNKL